MIQDEYGLAIAALLPLAAAIVVTEKNPFYALVMRGILGAVAALVYALFGAADVALTEALVGTMLSITLYAIAVRSSMTLRLGLLADEMDAIAKNPQLYARHEQLVSHLRDSLDRHYLRLECIPYTSKGALQTALQSKLIHGTCTLAPAESTPPYQLHLHTKLHRLMQSSPSAEANLFHVLPISDDSALTSQTDYPQQNSYEVQP